MPGVRQYPVTDSEVRKIDELFENERRARVKTITAMMNYYDGIYPPSLRPDDTQTDDNITVPLIGMGIDEDNASMLGVDDKGDVQGVRYVLTDTTQQETLETIWEANSKNLLHAKLFRLGSQAGHCFIKVLPDGKAPGVPRLIILDPRHISVFWQEDDMERVLWYRIEYANTRQDIVRGLTDDGRDTGSWIIYDYTRANEWSAQWKREKEERWQYPMPPIVEWQNQINANSYYGNNDIGTSANLNLAYNLARSLQQRLIKYKSHPLTIIYGADLGEEMDGATNTVINLPEGGRAELLQISGDALAPSLQHASLLRSEFFDGIREPDPSAVRGRLGELSNFDLRILYQPTLAKRQSKWLLAGEGLKRLVNTIFMLLGQPDPEGLKIVPPDPLPQNPTEQMTYSVTLLDKGAISMQTFQEINGVDPQQEQERMQDEQITQSIQQEGAPIGVSQ